MKSSSGESIDQGDVGKFTHIGIGAENQGKTCHPRLTGGIIAIFTLFDLNYRLLKFLLQPKTTVNLYRGKSITQSARPKLEGTSLRGLSSAPNNRTLTKFATAASLVMLKLE